MDFWRELLAAEHNYWAASVDVLLKDAQAWRSAAKGESEAAARGA